MNIGRGRSVEGVREGDGGLLYELDPGSLQNSSNKDGKGHLVHESEILETYSLEDKKNQSGIRAIRKQGC